MIRNVREKIKRGRYIYDERGDADTVPPHPIRPFVFLVGEAFQGSSGQGCFG